jgi:hypothetical protein
LLSSKKIYKFKIFLSIEILITHHQKPTHEGDPQWAAAIFLKDAS